MSLTATTSAVINRCDDLGLRELARCLLSASSVYLIRDLVLEAGRAARAIHCSALHFNQHPIAGFAKELDIASSRALVAVEKEIASLHTAELAAQTGVLTCNQRRG